MSSENTSFFKTKRILVTGACGTVGRELVRQLLEDLTVGELVGIDNNESELFFLEQRFQEHPHALFFLADVRDGKTSAQNAGYRRGIPYGCFQTRCPL